MNRRGRAAGVALVVSAGLLLSACDGGERPTDPPTTETASTQSPTPTETTAEPTETATPPEVEAPTPAPEVTTNDHVGAIWAARYFLDLYTYMRATGDTARFEAISAPECEFCAGAVETATGIHSDGGWVEGGALAFDIDQATAEYPSADEPNYLVRFVMEEAPFTVYDGSGDPQEEWDGETLEVVIATQFIDGRFVVFGVNFT